MQNGVTKNEFMYISSIKTERNYDYSPIEKRKYQPIDETARNFSRQNSYRNRIYCLSETLGLGHCG